MFIFCWSFHTHHIYHIYETERAKSHQEIPEILPLSSSHNNSLHRNINIQQHKLLTTTYMEATTTIHNNQQSL
jgi:hypothetical protein